MLASLLLAGQLALAVPDPYAGLAELRAGYASGALTAEAVVRAELARIAATNHAGPRLNALIAVAPDALDQARARDLARARGRRPGPLDGAPIVLKDNVEWAGPLATTAGSLALVGNRTGRDAPIVRGLLDAGAIVLGKANLSEWANFRSRSSISGWSAVGGLTRNPYALDRGTCGSSSGSAAAVAAGLAAAAIGTETDGSITCPAAAMGLVGFKPTLGLVSRTRIVPISPEQDTAGPITRSVADAALVLSVIAGEDPADSATAGADRRKPALGAPLDPQALRGARLGVLRGVVRGSPAADAVFERALQTLAAAGAVLVEVAPLPQAQSDALSEAETFALQTEFKAAIGAYLAQAAPPAGPRTLQDLIGFNAGAPAETALFGQETFVAAASRPGLDDPAYREQRARARRLAGAEGLDRMFAAGQVEAIVAQTGGPASVIDPVNGAKPMGSVSSLPAVAGYPHLTLPMGAVSGLPVGLSIIGPAWSDARVLAFGYAFEQAAAARLRPGFAASLPLTPVQARALDPP